MNVLYTGHTRGNTQGSLFDLVWYSTLLNLHHVDTGI